MYTASKPARSMARAPMHSKQPGAVTIPRFSASRKILPLDMVILPKLPLGPRHSVAFFSCSDIHGRHAVAWSSLEDLVDPLVRIGRAAALDVDQGCLQLLGARAGAAVA